MTKNINGMTSEELGIIAREKATAIYNELEEIGKYLVCYEPNGALCFYIRAFISINCKVIPSDNNTYLILLFHKHNRSQKTILSKINNLKLNDIHSTLSDTIDRLQNEWKEWNKDNGSWLDSYELVQI